MKIAGYILAVYVVLLAVVPCCTFDDCPDDMTATHNEQDPDQGKGDGDCGNCSPFFNCGGCATATIAAEPARIEIASLKILSVYTLYIQTALPRIEYDFWQPPKLG